MLPDKLLCEPGSSSEELPDPWLPDAGAVLAAEMVVALWSVDLLLFPLPPRVDFPFGAILLDEEENTHEY